MRILIISVFLAGCSVLDHGKDQSKIHIKHRCDVIFKDAADYGDQSKIGVATIKPDCTTSVEFRQNAGG